MFDLPVCHTTPDRCFPASSLSPSYFVIDRYGMYQVQHHTAAAAVVRGGAALFSHARSSPLLLCFTAAAAAAVLCFVVRSSVWANQPTKWIEWIQNIFGRNEWVLFTTRIILRSLRVDYSVCFVSSLQREFFTARKFSREFVKSGHHHQPYYEIFEFSIWTIEFSGWKSSNLSSSSAPSQRKLPPQHCCCRDENDFNGYYRRNLLWWVEEFSIIVLYCVVDSREIVDRLD